MYCSLSRGLGQPWPAGAGWSRLEPAGAGSPNPHVAVAHPEEPAALLGAPAGQTPGVGEQQPLCHRVGVTFRLPPGAPGAASGGGVGRGETHPRGRLAADRDLRRRRRGVCARDGFCLEAGGVEESARMKEQ